MKKRKIFTLLLALVMVLPVMLLSACKDKDNDPPADPTITGVSVELSGQTYTLEDDTITTVYDPETLISLSDTDFVVKLTYSDDTTTTITKDTDTTEGYTLTSTLPTTGTATGAGTYTVEFAYGTYEKTINVVVQKAKISLANASWNYSSAFEYNGGEKTVAITGLPAGVTATYAGNTGTNAGAYTATATLDYDDDNYELENVPSLTLEWNIGALTYDLSDVAWNYSTPFTYSKTGDEEQTFTIELTGLPEGVTATYTNNSKTKADTYTATATLVAADTVNHNPIPANKITWTQQWKINKANLDISGVNWNYTAGTTYGPTFMPYSLELTGWPQGIDVAEYHGNRDITGAGSGTVTVTLTQADTQNYNVVNAELFTLNWEVGMGTYDMTAVRWGYYSSENPQVVTPYTTALESLYGTGYNYTFVLMNLPAGVTATYNNNDNYISFDDNYNFQDMSVELHQADSVNYYPVSAETYNAQTSEFSIRAVEALSSVKLNGVEKGQAWFETLKYLPVGATLELTAKEGFTVNGDNSYQITAEFNSSYQIEVDRDMGERIFSKYLSGEYIYGLSINGFDLTNRNTNYELQSPTENTLTITLGTCPVTGDAYISTYENRLFYWYDGQKLPITADGFVIELEDSNNIEIYVDNDRAYYISVRDFTYIQSLVATTNKGEQNITSGSSISLSNTSGFEFVQDFEATIKTPYAEQNYTAVLKTMNNETLPADFFINNYAGQKFKVVVLDDALTVVETKIVEMNHNYSLTGTTNVPVSNGQIYTIVTQTHTIDPQHEYKIDNEETLTLTENEYGITKHTLSLSADVETTIYTFTADLYVIYSENGSLSTYVNTISFSYETGYYQSTVWVSIGGQAIASELGKSEIEALEIDWQGTVAAEGYTLISAEPTVAEVSYLTLTFEDSESTQYQIQVLVPMNFVYDDDTSIKSAKVFDVMAETYGSDVDLSGASVNLENMETYVGIYVETTNPGAKIEVTKQGSAMPLVSEYGEAEILFSAEGTYVLTITATDGTTNSITMVVTGEFLPLLGVNYSTDELTLNIDGSTGMPSGNMEALSGVPASYYPTAVQTAMTNLQIDPTEAFGVIGYLPSASSVDGSTITIEIVSSSASAVYDIDGNPVPNPSQATLTIQTDDARGKYVAFFGDVNNMIMPVVIYLYAKVWPVSFTIGEGATAQTFNYQLEMDLEGMTGNMSFGSFGMGESGPVAYGTTEGLNIEAGVTTSLEVIVTFGATHEADDYSYAVFTPNPEDPQQMLMAHTTYEDPNWTMAFRMNTILTPVETGVYSLTFYVGMNGATVETLANMMLPVTIYLVDAPAA